MSAIIVHPDLFDRERMAVVRQPFLLVDGVLQHQDGVLSVRAEHMQDRRQRVGGRARLLLVVNPPVILKDLASPRAALGDPRALVHDAIAHNDSLHS